MESRNGVKEEKPQILKDGILEGQNDGESPQILQEFRLLGPR